MLGIVFFRSLLSIIKMENLLRVRTRKVSLLALLALCGSQGTRVRPRGPDAAGDWDRGHGAGSGARRGPDSMELVNYFFLKAFSLERR